MSLRSYLLTVELPDASGKTVPYYTYDGYLEEADRQKIHAEKRSLEHLKVTGSALTGFLAYVVRRIRNRPRADSPCPSSPSVESPFPSLDWYLALLEPSSDTKSSACTEAADSIPSRERPSSLPSTCLCGRTSGTLSIPTVPTSSWLTTVTTSPSSSTPACSSFFTQDSRDRSKAHP